MSSLRGLAIWIFGEEGDILEDSATQALVVASSILVTGSTLISPLVADLALVFTVSETEAGWLIVSYTASAAVCLPFVGALSDRFGRKVIMTGGLVLFGIAGATVGLASDFELVLILRILQGVGFAASAPVILTVFGDLYKGSRETTVQGIRVAANSLMNSITPLISGILFVYSWQFPFILFAVSIPIAVWVWRSVPTMPQQNSRTFRRYVNETLVFLRQGAVALLMISFMLRFTLFYGLLTYVSVLATREATMAVVAVGALMSVRGIAKMVTSTQVGRLSLTYDPAYLACMSFGVLAIGVICMGAASTPLALTMSISATGMADGILSPSQKSIVNQISLDSNRAGLMSTAMTLQNVGKVLGPLVFGLSITAYGVASTFLILGFVVGTAGVVSLLGVLLFGTPSRISQSR